MNILILMMGGHGARFGAPIPKQYTLINGKPLFNSIVEGYDQLDFIDHIVIVSHSDWVDKVQGWCSGFSKLSAVVSGGDNRSQSVYNGLKQAASFAGADDVVLIHDATHPYIDESGIIEVINKTREVGAATLASFGYDTVYKIDDDNNIVEVLPRTRVVNGASPEAFLFGKIFPIYENATESELEQMTSAGAIALKNNIVMAFVQTDLLNLKITYQRDMHLYNLLGENYFFNDGNEV